MKYKKDVRVKREDISVYISIELHNQKSDLKLLDFAGGQVVKNLPASARGTGLIPGPGRSYMPKEN